MNHLNDFTRKVTMELCMYREICGSGLSFECSGGGRRRKEINKFIWLIIGLTATLWVPRRSKSSVLDVE